MGKAEGLLGMAIPPSKMYLGDFSSQNHVFRLGPGFGCLGRLVDSEFFRKSSLISFSIAYSEVGTDITVNKGHAQSVRKKEHVGTKCTRLKTPPRSVQVRGLPQAKRASDCPQDCTGLGVPNKNNNIGTTFSFFL